MKNLLSPVLLSGVLTSVLMCSLTFASEPASQTSTSDLAIAQQLMQNKQSEAACNLLRPSTSPDSHDVDKLYLMGLCSTDIGQYHTAAEYFQRLITLRPELPRPLAKLGQLYLREGRYTDAGRLFSEAADLNSEESGTLMMRAIANRLQATDLMKLAASMGKPWNVQLYAGLVIDDNVNAGPLSRNVPVLLGGVPVTFELTDAAMPRSSMGLAMGLGGSYLFPLNQNWSFILRGNYFGTRYFSEQDFGNDSLALAGDFVFRARDFSASIQPNMRYTRLDTKIQERANGVTTRVEQKFSPQVSLTGSLGYQDRTITIDPNRDADVWLSSVGINWQAADKLLLNADYVVQKDKANSDIYSRHLRGPAVTAVWQPLPKLTLIGGYSYLDSEYQAKMALFAAPREDTQKVASLTALWNLNSFTALRLQYVNIDNPSNISYNSFEREVVSFGIQMTY